MAIRTTSDAVEEIVETEVTISLTPFIEIASAMVDELLVDAGYGDTYLELIERWLSAHFYSIRDMKRASEQVKTLRESFQYKVDLYLAVTVYGQQVLALEYKGILAALQKRIQDGTRPGMTWLGTEST